MPHSHSHEERTALRGAQRRALWIALTLNASFLVAEVIGGLAFNSLALLADAGHMLSDVAGLGIALIAQSLLDRPPSDRHTFGLQRAEVLGALANGVVLVGAVAWIGYEAARRLMDPEEVAGRGLLSIALIGLAINVASAVLLARARGRSLNMHGAYIHMASDALGSVAVVAAAVAVILWDATWVDPAASLMIGVLILWATWSLLQDAVHVLMEGVPKGIDRSEVHAAIAAAADVASVHHLHLWTISSDLPSLSAHVTLEGDYTLHDAQDRSDEIKEMLKERFGIEHSTLEIECHPCADEVTG